LGVGSVSGRTPFDSAFMALGQDVERQADDGRDDVAHGLPLGLRTGVGGRDEHGRQGDGHQNQSESFHCVMSPKKEINQQNHLSVVKHKTASAADTHASLISCFKSSH
jgi:hypothetical protein